MYPIGIDIGGMSAKLGLIEGDRVWEEEIIPTHDSLDYELFLEGICDSIRRLGKKGGADRVGISSFGLINNQKGSIVYSNNIRWENKSIAGDVAEKTGLPVKIANDAKCAALAEAVYGAGRRYGRVCMITLGTGVGGAFLTGKHLGEDNPYGDADGILGHITVESNGRQCTCGRKGCLEAYSSASAVMESYQERTGLKRTAEDIFQKAREGEMPAKATVAEFQYYLGEGLTSLVNVLRPEIIVIGGGVSKSADLFLSYLNEYVNKNIYGGDVLPVKIAAAKLGNKAGMIGAALL